MEQSCGLVALRRHLSCESLNFCGNCMDPEAWNCRNRFDIILLLERGALWLSIPLLVCFPCSSSAGVSGGVVGWIHCQTHWQLAPYGNWLHGAVSVHPTGRGRPAHQAVTGSKSVKLLLKVFPEATLCWAILVFVVWRFGGLLFCFGLFWDESCALLLISRCS